MLARAHHFFVFVTVADKARRLERAVDAVAGIAQAGNDVAVLVQVVVLSAQVDVNIGVSLVQGLDAFRSGDQTV